MNSKQFVVVFIHIIFFIGFGLYIISKENKRKATYAAFVLIWPAIVCYTADVC